MGRVVLGSVNGTTGLPNRQVAIYAASDTTLSTPLKQVTTNAQGYFGFDSLPDGSYIVAPVGVSGGSYTPLSRAATLAGAPKFVGAFGFASSAGGGVAGSALSSVRLSLTSVQDALVRLTFTGALAASATEPSRYSVSVNSADVEVEGATVNGNSVTLLLPASRLKTGHEVRVGYELEDVQGRRIAGETTLTAP
jgi:hypothetical protein